MALANYSLKISLPNGKVSKPNLVAGLLSGLKFQFFGQSGPFGLVGLGLDRGRDQVGTRSGPMGVAREKNVVLEHSSFRHPVRQIVGAHNLPPTATIRRG